MSARSETPRKQCRVLIHGASGRMGQALLRLAAARPDMQVVAAISRRVGQRVMDGVPYFDASELSGAAAFDVAIDFSVPAGFDQILHLCAERNAALVSGTTGLNEGQYAALDHASTRIPVLWAPSFSVGIVVLAELVRRSAQSLEEWDCDIVESHHRHKRDAPSGTALLLGAAAEQGGARPRYSSIRAGDIVGEHTVQFATDGERVELTHRAGSRDIFARGALHAATRLSGRAAGNYSLTDLID